MWSDIHGPVFGLLHVLPVRHGPAADPFLVAALVAVGVAASIALGVMLGRRVMAEADSARAAIAFGLGALLFLFFDLVKETASLGQGLVSDPGLQVLLLGAFVAGVLLPSFVPVAAGEARRMTAWVWVFAVAAHGAAEGWIVGTESLTIDLLDPFQGTSFLLHKAVEGLIIMVVAGTAWSRRDSWFAVGFIAATAAVGVLAGHVFGWGMAAPVLFALGAGGSVQVLLRLAPSLSPGWKVSALVAGGVVFVWLAGLLHNM